MKPRTFLTALAVLAVAAPSAGQAGDPNIPKQLRALTPEGVEKKVSIKDDALELVATFTTSDVFREKRGLIGIVPFDVFLRAFVDKKSGHVSYQVYASDLYVANVWTRWMLANYETATGPMETKLDVLARVRGSCRHPLGCSRLETVAFPVEERVLRTAAVSYQRDTGAVWRFKLKAQTGRDHTEVLATAEIAGLLRAVDSYKAANGLPSG